MEHVSPIRWETTTTTVRREWMRSTTSERLAMCRRFTNRESRQDVWCFPLNSPVPVRLDVFREDWPTESSLPEAPSLGASQRPVRRPLWRSLFGG